MLGRRLRLVEPAGADEAHHLDRVGDEPDRLDCQLVGAVAQRGVHPIGRRIAEQEQVDGPPALTDEREDGVIGLGRGGDQLVGQDQSMVGVPGREEHVMGE